MSSIGTEREERIRWWHRLPRGRPVERHEALIEAARGRRVVHVGFVDELMASKIAQDVWLHARLAAVASSLVGLDSSEEGVAAARADGYEAYVVDAQSAEAVRALGLRAGGRRDRGRDHRAPRRAGPVPARDARGGAASSC